MKPLYRHRSPVDTFGYGYALPDSHCDHAMHVAESHALGG